MIRKIVTLLCVLFLALLIYADYSEGQGFKQKIGGKPPLATTGVRTSKAGGVGDASMGYYWYTTAIGAGGWIPAAGIFPTNPNLMVVGADVTGIYASRDGGKSWYQDNGGLNQTGYSRDFYVHDILGFDNGQYQRWYAATGGGIYSRGPLDGTWVKETPVSTYNWEYSSVRDLGWGLIGYPIGFNTLATDGGSLLIAGAGEKRQRVWSDHTYWETNYYPNECFAFSCYDAYHRSHTSIGDDTENWGTDEWKGCLVTIFAGTGAGQSRVVISNTNQILTVAAWDVDPDATSDFMVKTCASGTHALWRKILGDPNGEAWRPVTGYPRTGTIVYATASATGSNTITTTGTAWTTNEFVGYRCEIPPGYTGAGQTRTITANTGTQLTVTPAWTTQPTGAVFYVRGPSLIRDVAVRVVDGDTVIAVAARDGVWLDPGTGTWENVGDTRDWNCKVANTPYTGNFDYTDYDSPHTERSWWGVEINEEGRIYASLRANQGGGTYYRSGIYVLEPYDSPTAEWQYVGHPTTHVNAATGAKNTEWVDMNAQGVNHYWMCLNDGAGSDPDTLTVADSYEENGLLVGVIGADLEAQVWTQKVWHWWQNNIYPDTFPDAWQDDFWNIWGTTLAVCRNNADYILWPASVRITTSHDGGDSWLYNDSIKSAVNDGYWRARGGMTELMALSSSENTRDGRIALGVGDEGAMVSATNAAVYWDTVTPATVNADSSFTEGLPWGRAAWDCAWYPNFEGGFYDALLVLFVDYQTVKEPMRLMAWVDNGTTQTWTTVPTQSNPHRYTADCFAVGPNGHIYVPYELFTADVSLCTATNISSIGVLDIYWSGSSWTTDTWNTGLQAAAAPYWMDAVDICFTGNRCWVAYRGNDSQAGCQRGGLWYRDIGAGSWAEVASWDTYNDVHSVCSNAAGTKLYVGCGGTRGASAGVVLEDVVPGSGSPKSGDFTVLVNGTSGTPIFDWGFSTDVRGWEMYTTLTDWSRARTQVNDVKLQPNDENILWIGLPASGAYLDPGVGLYTYNLSNHVLRKVDRDFGGRYQITDLSFTADNRLLAAGVGLATTRVDGQRQWALEYGRDTAKIVIPTTACGFGVTVNSEAVFTALCASQSVAAVSITCPARFSNLYLGVQYSDGGAWQNIGFLGGDNRKIISTTSPADYYPLIDASPCSSFDTSVRLRYNFFTAISGGTALFADWCGPENVLVFQ